MRTFQVLAEDLQDHSEGSSSRHLDMEYMEIPSVNTLWAVVTAMTQQI